MQNRQPRGKLKAQRREPRSIGRTAVINRRALSVHQFMAKSERMAAAKKALAEWTCVAREHFMPRPRARHATAAISTIVNARFISSQSTWSVDLG